MPEPKLYGLIGFPLDHSFSPAYFRGKFEKEGIDAEYEAFPLPSLQEFEPLLQTHPRLEGLNVTTPYKGEVLTLLHELSPDAETIGAVNCIAVRDRRRIGYNTDWIGFRDSLIPLLRPHLWPALILGNGGASRAV